MTDMANHGAKAPKDVKYCFRSVCVKGSTCIGKSESFKRLNQNISRVQPNRVQG
eukprot:m.231559 g.231559  ORF g.231559 m.231559 type:complete len:54 (+) comp15693_c1_seq1:91-252(+)